MDWKCLYALVVCVALINACSGSQVEDRLQSLLFTNYNKNVRPVESYNESLVLEFGLSITQLLEVHEKNQIIVSSCWVEQVWVDYRLSWNPYNFNNVSYLVIPTDWVWRPDIVLENSGNGVYNIPLSQFVTLESDGTVYLTPPAIFEVPCKLNIKYFPFDVQQCSLHFGPWEYTGEHVSLRPLYDVVIRDKYTTNTEWNLINSTVEIIDDFPECCPDEVYSVLAFTLTFARRPLYYIVNILVPCLMMALLTLLMFCLHPDSGEKISLGISILIAMSVFSLLVADIMPPTSEMIPVIAQYVMFNMFLIACSTVISVGVLSLHNRNVHSLHMHPVIRKIFMHYIPKALCMQRCHASIMKSHSITHDLSPHVCGSELKTDSKTGQVVVVTHTNTVFDQDEPQETNCNSSVNIGNGRPHKKAKHRHCRKADSTTLEQLLEEVMLIRQRAQHVEAEKLMLDDWKYVAAVVDRMFLYVSTLVYIIGTFVIFAQPEVLSSL
uniref:Neuronal acetylcholine receptor subunit alpha-2-like n=1 Tax=Saccoglossus kowalevskii TaxID=10224 RepID=A0ABM0LXM9_SACKO|nr:PREDICTED: neuronal acetylcholine receptor subunit alpha-2-like [Saccoglossus kowalevskii]